MIEFHLLAIVIIRKAGGQEVQLLVPSCCACQRNLIKDGMRAQIGSLVVCETMCSGGASGPGAWLGPHTLLARNKLAEREELKSCSKLNF